MTYAVKKTEPKLLHICFGIDIYANCVWGVGFWTRTSAACMNALCAANAGAQLLAYSLAVFKRLQRVLSAAYAPTQSFTSLC